MRADISVEGDAPLCPRDLQAVACAVLNESAREKRRGGAANPYRSLKTLAEIQALLKKHNY